jgi:hypothetical protein
MWIDVEKTLATLEGVALMKEDAPSGSFCFALLLGG